MIRIEPLPPTPEPRPASHPPSPPTSRAPEARYPGAPEPNEAETDSAAGELAAHYYRPVYERQPCGDTYVHIVMANLVGLPGTGPNVLHTCDNPPCFEPAHLFRGTQSDNMKDCRDKGRLRPGAGRHNIAKTHCPQGHPYSEANTYVSAKGSRICRACRVRWPRKVVEHNRPPFGDRP